MDNSFQLRVLVIDDNELSLDSLEDMVRVSGNIPVTAASPQAAIDACQGQEFDLAIVDYALPQMTGIELIEELRKLCKETAYILISGCPDVSLIRECRNAGAGIFFRKPIQAEQVLEYLELAKREIASRHLD